MILVITKEQYIEEGYTHIRYTSDISI